MKKMTFFIIVSISINTLTSDGAFKVHASVELPQLGTLSTTLTDTVHNVCKESEGFRAILTNTSHQLCQEFDKLTSSFDNSINKATSSFDNSVNKATSSFENSVNKLTFSLDNSVNKVTYSINNAINIFDPQNILLCLCGVICTYTGVTILQNTPDQKVIGTTLTAIGVTLTIFSKCILRYINS